MTDIAIVGGSTTTWGEAASIDPKKTEVWGLNSVALPAGLSPARWFQLHPKDWRHNGQPYGRPPEHYQFLKTCGVPVYMQYPDPEIPTAVPYPLEGVLEWIGAYFLIGTPAYMLALALYEGNVETVRLFGVELDGNSDEYIKQRPSLLYLIGWARGAGVRVLLPERSVLMKAPLYAVDEFPHPTPPVLRAMGVA